MRSSFIDEMYRCELCDMVLFIDEECKCQLVDDGITVFDEEGYDINDTQ